MESEENKLLETSNRLAVEVKCGWGGGGERKGEKGECGQKV